MPFSVLEIKLQVNKNLSLMYKRNDNTLFHCLTHWKRADYVDNTIFNTKRVLYMLLVLAHILLTKPFTQYSLGNVCVFVVVSQTVYIWKFTVMCLRMYGSRIYVYKQNMLLFAEVSFILFSSTCYCYCSYYHNSTN